MTHNGSTTLDHLLAVYEATGEKPAELERLQELECPYELFHVWVVFQTLCATRSSNGFGPNPLSYQEILAYMQCGGIELDDEEIEILKQIDIIYMDKMNDFLTKKMNK